MSSTLLDRPSPRVEPRPPPRPSRAPDPPRRRAGPRWAFPAALALSAAVHLIALLVLQFELEIVPVGAPDDPQVVNRPVGMRVYDIVAVDEAPALPREEARPDPLPPETQPEQQPAPDQPQPEPADPAAATPADPPPAARSPGSVAERVSPRMGDPRLWTAPGVPDEAPIHRDEAVRRRLANRIDAWNDSVRLADQAAAKAVDWTVKDGEGGRWGVSPDGIHLGSITLPIPVRFGTPPGRREDAAAAQRSWSEIQAQRGRAEAAEGIKDRIEAIRERKAAERRDTTSSGGGGS